MPRGTYSRARASAPPPASAVANEVAARDLVARLRARLAQNATLSEAARELPRSKSDLHRLAVRHNLPRRRRSTIDQAKRKQIDAAINRDESERVIVRVLQVGKGTIYRRKQQRRKRLGLPKVVKPYVCAGCRRRVIYVPCQVCKALGNTAG